jgi:SAM-dependent methyltransferase
MSTPSERSAEERARIERVYKERMDASKSQLYRDDRPEIKQEKQALEEAVRETLDESPHIVMADLRFLDVGCGSGSHLRTMIQWGAEPKHLAGTELVEDRLDEAMRLTEEGPLWHLGPLEGLPDDRPFDVVSAFTVFSSILDEKLREELAREMWNRTAAGGAVLVYDFRYNNPTNPDVRRITKREIIALFPEGTQTYRTLTLAPPLARRITPLSERSARMLTQIAPLRSHSLFVARKDK